MLTKQTKLMFNEFTSTSDFQLIYFLSILLYNIIEKTSCDNVLDVKHNDLINRVDFSWNSSHEAVVAFSVSICYYFTVHVVIYVLYVSVSSALHVHLYNTCIHVILFLLTS